MLDFFTRAFFFLLPFQGILAIGGTDYPFIRVVAALFLGWWLVLAFVTKERVLPPLPLSSFLLGWLGIVLVSVLLSPDPWLSVRKMIFLVNIFPLTLVWYAIIPSRVSRYQVISAALWGGAAAAFLGLVFFTAQFFVGAGPVFHFLVDSIFPLILGERLSTLVAAYPSLLVNIGGETWLRLTAFFPDPHGAAYFFGMLSCLAFGTYFTTKEKKFLFVGTLLFLADLLTFSRGGYVGLGAAATVFYLFLLKKNRWLSPWTVFLVGLLPLGVLLGLPIIERFISTFSLSDASSIDRITLWWQALETWLLFPWFGLGIGQYANWLYPEVGQTIPYYAHNLYLDLAVETGLLGLVSFLALGASSLLRAVRNVQQGSLFFWGVIAAWMLYLAHSLFETALFSLPVAILCTLLLIVPFTEDEPKYPVQ